MRLPFSGPSFGPDKRAGLRTHWATKGIMPTRWAPGDGTPGLEAHQLPKGGQHAHPTLLRSTWSASNRTNLSCPLSSLSPEHGLSVTRQIGETEAGRGSISNSPSLG